MGFLDVKIEGNKSFNYLMKWRKFMYEYMNENRNNRLLYTIQETQKNDYYVNVIQKFMNFEYALV